MTVELLEVDLIQRIIDENGVLTLEGIQIIQRMQEMLRDHEARIEALEP